VQHTATHCNTLQHTTTHYNTLQHNAIHYNTPQHTATHINENMCVLVTQGGSPEAMKNLALAKFGAGDEAG